MVVRSQNDAIFHYGMKKEITIVVTVLVVILGIAFFINTPTVRSTKYDAFAMCIKDSGTIFYGAFWCPHCKAQKALFGDSVKYLPYVECSTADGKSQLPVCIENGVKNYPTWVFANGDRLTGEVSLAQLATKTSCSLPEEVLSTTTPINTGDSSSVIDGATSTESVTLN